MYMKLNGESRFYPMDGQIYQLEAYLPEKEVYVSVQVCDDEWCFAVSGQSMEVYGRETSECYEHSEEYAESAYEDVFRTLKGMVNVMRLANG